MMDEGTKRKLKGLNESKRLVKITEDIRSGFYAAKSFLCAECGSGIRTPRMLKLDGKRRPSGFVTFEEIETARGSPRGSP
ncbi:MAG TPA: hypothetical protein VJN63_05620 [Thermoplasmata archaeon]|nr:hypothetical protein [Thermoplasmata archaeon]